MRRAGAVVVWAPALVLALAGCGGSPDAPVAEPSPTAPSTSSAPVSPTTPSGSPTASESGGIDPSLAAAAAELAAAAQAQASQLPENRIPPRQGTVIGADVSWPQCPAGMGIPHKMSTGQRMPDSDAEYVLVGLTNGPGFTANPCLGDQVAWVREHGLLVGAYSVISWPDGPAQQQYGGLREAGYAEATYNIASMTAAGIRPPIVWLDIESVPFYDWSKDTSANAEVVVGAAQGYLEAGYRVGVYSTPALWRGIVGDLQLGVPEWRAAGKTSAEEAARRCGGGWSIQGGEAVLAQWVEAGRDKNLTCPGTEARLGEYFTTFE